MELARAVVEITERLKGVREGIRNGRLKFAAEEVRELKKALRVRDGGDVADESEREREPVVYGLLKKEWSDCFEEVWISKSFFVRFCFIAENVRGK